MLYGLFVLVLAGIVFLVIFNMKNGKKEREAGTKEAARDKAPAREKTPDPVQARESHPSDMGQAGLGQQPGVPRQAGSANQAGRAGQAGLDYTSIAYRSDRPESPSEVGRESSKLRENAGPSVPRKSGDEMYRQALRQMASPEEAPAVEEQQEELRGKPDSDQAYREALRRILERQSEAREQQNHEEPRQP
ncbi:hypothetical protein [Paenibacillus sp. J22TS3]|uniref:hypothetical protein n=1 Tax=Paenibacillus sp. J22TS3 TaxID=2807192 RepID=UPI001B1EAD51|nr:hypothetical protein [Paenibacillus sp. J22TS3]GIP21882.1 hypothetical protein J22TS3_21570 [Paenibacillus sp. J22TS3]